MLSHYIKITLRNLNRSRLHAFINILGLSIGISCAVLIVLYIKDELSFDKQHANSERIYRLFYEAERRDGSQARSAMVPIAMGEEIKDNYSDVAAKTMWYQFSSDIRKEGESFTESIHMVDPAFLDMFTFEVEDGTLSDALSSPSDIVISRSMAEKYFGDQPAIGKTLSLGLTAEPELFEVKAVVHDPPANSTHRFDFLISSLKAGDILPEEMLSSWHLVNSESYVMLSPGAEPESLDFEPLVERVMGESLEGRSFEIGLQPLTDIHMNNEMPQGLAPVSDPKYTFILTAVCILILVMACINFVNLSLGRSFGRAREIGVKKVAGAERQQLAWQFLSEAVIVSVFSLIFGLLLAYLVLPLFNTLAGKELQFSFSPENLILFLALAIIVGLAAGIYPAIVMSGFRPAQIIKGNLIVGQGGGKIRHGMIIMQLVLSVFLITSVLFMKDQLSFIQNRNLGFNKEQLAVLPVTVTDARGFMEVIELGWQKAQRGQPYFAGLPGVEDVAISVQEFEGSNWMQAGYNDDSQVMHSFNFNVVDARFISTLGIEIVRGRNFRVDDVSDERRSVIVNEAFVKAFGLNNALGERIPHEAFPDHEIIGVVKDFNYASLHSKIEPMVLVINPAIILEGINNLNINSSIAPKLMVRMEAGRIAESMSSLESAWEKVYGEDPFMASFVDETIQSQYERDRHLNTIITAATVISILIGTLGLFGLATLTMNARAREMGIRKVLGADIFGMILELSRSYLVLILVAIILSLPLTYFFVKDWLSEFEFRIEISPVTFIAGGVILLSISLLVLIWQSLRVARTNPAHALRSE